MGFDGKDGSLLWEIPTRGEIFELVCPAIDVNLDGSEDCFASGRLGTFIAFDPRSGELLAL